MLLLQRHNTFWNTLAIILWISLFKWTLSYECIRNYIFKIYRFSISYIKGKECFVFFLTSYLWFFSRLITLLNILYSILVFFRLLQENTFLHCSFIICLNNFEIRKHKVLIYFLQLLLQKLSIFKYFIA